MCIIVLKKPNEIVSKATLDICYENNDHAAGILVGYKDSYWLYKNVDFDEVWKTYQAYRKDKGFERKEALELWHFRIRSKGDLSIKNAQPFILTDENGHFIGGFAHNGTMTEFGEGDISDSREVAEQLIKNLPPDWYKNPVFHKMMKAVLGTGRAVFITPEGIPIIYNEKSGYWEGGIWYSNGSYKRYATSYTGGVYTSTRNTTYYGTGRAVNYNSHIVLPKKAYKYTLRYATVLYDPLWTIGMNDKKSCQFCDGPLLTSGEYSTKTCINCMDTYFQNQEPEVHN